MKYKTKKAFVKYFNTLTWYCINWDFNNKRPVYINILAYIDAEELFKRLTYSGSKPNTFNCISSADDFYNFCRSYLTYRFSGDANFEMSLGNLNLKVTDECYKLSVYDQIEPNLNHIINYLITSLDLYFPLLDVTSRRSERSGIDYV